MGTEGTQELTAVASHLFGTFPKFEGSGSTRRSHCLFLELGTQCSEFGAQSGKVAEARA